MSAPKRAGAKVPSPVGLVRVVQMAEAEEMVERLNKAIDDVLTLGEFCQEESPYNLIALETMISLRHMRDVLRLEMGAAL